VSDLVPLLIPIEVLGDQEAKFLRLLRVYVCMSICVLVCVLVRVHVCLHTGGKLDILCSFEMFCASACKLMLVCACV
jgi:hypothetical protein